MDLIGGLFSVFNKQKKKSQERFANHNGNIQWKWCFYRLKILKLRHAWKNTLLWSFYVFIK